MYLEFQQKLNRDRRKKLLKIKLLETYKNKQNHRVYERIYPLVRKYSEGCK